MIKSVFALVIALTQNALANPNQKPPEVFAGQAYACNFGIKSTTAADNTYGEDSAVAMLGSYSSTGSGTSSSNLVIYSKKGEEAAAFDSLGNFSRMLTQLSFNFTSEKMGASYFVDFCMIGPFELNANACDGPGSNGNGSGNGNCGDNGNGDGGTGTGNGNGNGNGNGSGNGGLKPVVDTTLDSYGFEGLVSGQSLGVKEYWNNNRVAMTAKLVCDLRKVGSKTEAPKPGELPAAIENDYQYSFNVSRFTGNSSLSTMVNMDPAMTPRFCVLRLEFTENSKETRSHQQQIHFTADMALTPRSY
ncbi:MAG: hypothetical protein ACLGGX_06065 [Bdellovibrionia bacterium]